MKTVSDREYIDGSDCLDRNTVSAENNVMVNTCGSILISSASIQVWSETCLSLLLGHKATDRKDHLLHLLFLFFEVNLRPKLKATTSAETIF